MEKKIDWNGKAEKARGMTDAELRYAIDDCAECVRCGVDGGYYSDEGSIYRAEYKKRNDAREARNRRARENRRNRDEAMRSMGMTKVRVNGKIYWE